MTETALVKRDVELIAAFETQFSNAWDRIRASLRRSAIANWEVGHFLGEIRKGKLYRGDAEFMASIAGNGEARNFDAWAAFRLPKWSRSAIYLLEELAREFDRATIEQNPALLTSHFLAVAKNTGKLSEGDKALARKRALKATSEDPDPSAKRAAQIAREAAGEFQSGSDEELEEDGGDEAEEIDRGLPSVGVATVFLGNVPAEFECTYHRLDGTQVKRVRIDEESGQPLVGGLFMRIRMNDDYAIEVPLDRHPKGRLCNR